MLGIEFGESIFFKKLHPPGRRGKLDTLWETGAFVGCRGMTGEYTVIGKQGALKSRTVRRRPLEERWSKEEIENIKYTPWRVKDPAEETRTYGQARNPRIDVRVDRNIEMPELTAEDEERASRRVRITRAMLDENGYTDGCPGWTASAIGGTGLYTTRSAASASRAR